MLSPPPSSKELDTYSGKVVFLTGATGGLGRALALRLAECHVKSLILSGRKLDALEQVSRQCQAIYPQLATELVVCDLADPKSVESAALMAQQRPIDLLINNGGVSSRSRFLDTTPDVDAKIMQINFLAGAALAKAIVPGMVAQRQKKQGRGGGGGGRIIWISSVQGLIGIPHRSSYAASKFAVQGYTESIRAELKTSGVEVCTVSPGYIRTDLSKSAITGDGGTYGRMDPTTEAGADPQDVAAQLLQRIAAGEVDFTIATTVSSLIAIVLRFFFPWLMRRILVNRYEKSLIQEKKND